MTTYVLILFLNMGTPAFTSTTAYFIGLDACQQAGQAVMEKMKYTKNDFICLARTGE